MPLFLNSFRSWRRLRSWIADSRPALASCILLASQILASNGLFAADATPPTPPRGIQAAALAGNEVEVHWIASMDNVGVAGYRIYRCLGTCPPRPWPGTFAPVGAVSDSTIFVDRTVGPETRYTYIVTAFDAAGNESGSGATTGHDHQPHTLPQGYTAAVDVIYPRTVAPGAIFQIRRVLKLNPAMTFAHTDFHYRTKHGEPYRNWPFGRPSVGTDASITVSAPSTPGIIYFYSETHLLLGASRESPLCSRWFEIIVTNGEPLEIRRTSPPAGKLGTPYQHTFSAAGEIPGPYRWGITHGGSFPPGLTLDSKSGTITGVPVRSATFSFTAMVEADSGAIATRPFAMVIQ